MMCEHIYRKLNKTATVWVPILYNCELLECIKCKRVKKGKKTFIYYPYNMKTLEKKQKTEAVVIQIIIYSLLTILMLCYITIGNLNLWGVLLFIKIIYDILLRKKKS